MYTTFSTELDALTNGGGSLDPMGLYPTADRLASALVPGVRERMSNLRYLTATALGAELCREISVEVGWAKVVPPYMAFEWHLVQGWIHQFKGQPEAIGGMPGIQKAQESHAKGWPLNNARYLKAASVFGFHGVYRTLAQEIGVVDEEYRLLGLGAQLAASVKKRFDPEEAKQSWEKIVSRFQRSIRETMEKGETSKKWNWDVHGVFARLLQPHEMTTEEKSLLFDALHSDEHPQRKQLLEFLAQKGGGIWRSRKKEREVYEAFAHVASDETSRLVHSILAYELFSRVLTDAFDSVLRVLEQGGLIRTEGLAALPAVVRASLELPSLYRRVMVTMAATELQSEMARVERAFGAFGQPSGSVADFMGTMQAHHLTIQKSKGQQGKQPWMRQTEDGRWVADIFGRSESVEPDSLEFVHQYRCTPLYAFLKTLGHVEG
jgi:hypothetical protein